MKVDPATYPAVSPVTCLVTVNPPSTRTSGLVSTTPTVLSASLATMVTVSDGSHDSAPQA